MDILFGRAQLPVIISFFVCGVMCGILYDVLKIKRRIFGSRAVILFFDDLLFMLVATVTIIFNAYAFNNGNFKWYEVPVMTLGFFLYMISLSRLFTAVCFAVIDTVKRFIEKYFITPIEKLLRIIVKTVRERTEKIRLAWVLHSNSRKIIGCRF